MSIRGGTDLKSTVAEGLYSTCTNHEIKPRGRPTPPNHPSFFFSPTMPQGKQATTVSTTRKTTRIPVASAKRRAVGE